MKFHPRVLLLAAGTVAAGILTASAQDGVTVIPRPTVNDGSNASRAPFPSDRQFSDVTPPDGQAVDESLPPNTEATEPPPPPPATVAIFVPDTPATEPTLSMTGRPTVGIGAALQTDSTLASIRSHEAASRDPLFAQIDAQLDASKRALGDFRRSASEMSAGNRDQFKSAEKDLKAKESALRESLRAARRADAQEWPQARSRLAADYEAYAAAAARIDALAGIQPTTN